MRLSGFISNAGLQAAPRSALARPPFRVGPAGRCLLPGALWGAKGGPTGTILIVDSSCLARSSVAKRIRSQG